ncbi:MAG: VOC family protein [Acidimicrobiales bacterium]
MSSLENRLYQQPWPEGEYRMFQLGFVVVDDVVEGAARWASVFGVGPFHVLPSRELDCRYRGEASQFEMQVAVAQAGPLQIELVSQPDDRPSVIRDLFARGESGLHQLCTVTPDYDAKKAFYEGLGYELVCELDGRTQRFGYFDTAADFGFVTEVVEDAPGFLDQIAAIAETCATWDGTDPVRLMTRDGYTTP